MQHYDKYDNFYDDQVFWELVHCSKLVSSIVVDKLTTLQKMR